MTIESFEVAKTIRDDISATYDFLGILDNGTIDCEDCCDSEFVAAVNKRSILLVELKGNEEVTISSVKCKNISVELASRLREVVLDYINEREDTFKKI